MQITHTIKEVRAEIARQRTQGRVIGFVSTLGDLHDGHTSLVKTATAHCDFVVSGIFLNPFHFAADEDFDSYPRTFEEDCQKLAEVDCDLVFAPSISEMYPLGLDAQTRVEVPLLSARHCGASRPHLFGAVATVVTKLFNILQPDVALFGEKDFQQLAIVKRMVDTLNISTTIVSSPTIREPSGLAMSSRNNYLSAQQKEQAAGLYRALCYAQKAVLAGTEDFASLSCDVKNRLVADGFRPDYVNFANPETLEDAEPTDPAVVLLGAAWLGNVRLIDNILITRNPRECRRLA